MLRLGLPCHQCNAMITCMQKNADGAFPAPIMMPKCSNRTSSALRQRHLAATNTIAGLVKSVASKTAKRSPWRQTVHIFSFSFFQRKQSRCQHRPGTQEYWRACCLQKEINIKNVFFSHEALIDHNNFHFYLLFTPRCFNATL